ncbi:MAG TPA: DUF222 domain-containing protein [Acidimicrobiia bacterium]|jgi:hypothetical protein
MEQGVEQGVGHGLRSGMECLDAAVDALVAVDPATIPDVVLADELVALRARMDRLEAVFAGFAAAAHRRGVGLGEGAASTAVWLAQHAGMRTGEARAAIECGEAASVLSESGAAWRDGEVSTGAFRWIAGARVAEHDDLLACEPVLLGLAKSGDLRSLRRAAGHFRNLARADSTPPGIHDGLYLSKAYSGTHVLSAELSDLAAETVATALHAYTDPPRSDDARTAAKRRADALVRICDVALEHRDAGRAQSHASVVIDWSTLTNGSLGRLDGEFTGPIHPADIQRLLCDCGVSRVVAGPDSLPLDAGRTTRSVPAATRRALAVRDGGCRHPGCDRPPGWCDAHHVVHWTHGGQTRLDNLVLLCDRHHQVVHQPGWTTKFDGHIYAVYRPDGTEIT